MTAPAPEPSEEKELVIPADHAGARLDATLAKLLTNRSRSFITMLIDDGAILLNGQPAKPSKKVKGGDTVSMEWPEPEVIEAKAENIPLRVIHEDSDLIVVNKPAHMCTHPGPGHGTGTLVNALLGHCKDLSGINGALRPGIVHRLDMDTSGVIVSAKNDRTHQALQEQFANREVKKQYLALCYGNPPRSPFSCNGRIGRHPTRRTEMTVMRGADEGREAYTEFEVLQRLREGRLFLVLAKPRTGRTHQIRVHLAKASYPILCDGMYGKETVLDEINLSRHALHAYTLEITHPGTGVRMKFAAPLEDDMKNALLVLGGQPIG